MQVIHEEILINSLPPEFLDEIHEANISIRGAISKVDWPPNSGSFTIRPESGKKRGMGNGVKPIRKSFINILCKEGQWLSEQELDLDATKKPGKVDAMCEMALGVYCLEWETGNISSCHRSINKMALGIQKHKIIGGSVIVPSRALYPYLTDRIANYDELIPYFDLWKSLSVEVGYLSIFVVQHDATSNTVPRIPKGTDGRSSV